MAIYDTMQFVKPDIATYCMGHAASAAAVLLSAGNQGQAVRTAALADHDPPAAHLRSRGSGDRHRDPRQGDPQPATRSTRSSPDHTGRPLDDVQSDTDRDFWLSAKEAVDYGVLTQFSKAASSKPSAGRGGHTWPNMRERAPQVQFLREVAETGQEADRGSRRLHL